MTINNHNCLEGIACPKCGNHHRFKIAVETLAMVTDDGAEAIGDMNWNEESDTHCAECGHHARLKDFRINPRSPNFPPDPEGMNDQRSAWAEAAIAAFRLATGTDEEDALCDLLADLMHWSDRNNYDFEAAFTRGRDHYEAETMGERP
ncbi:MAG: hypothetical protein IAG10_05700 [Planctomycetaceae bacterium]|nr:hypothetical protein [Planctomycetaceae bacterium]